MSNDMEKVQHKSNQSSGDELDQILDAALAKYTSAEPRPGLELRILANLRSANVPSRQPLWWRWGLRAALAAILVALVIGLRSTKPTPTVARHQMFVQPGSTDPELHKLEHPVDVDGRQAPIDISAVSTITIRRKPRVPKNPKLDVFPSPHPLSEQEQLLARYVAQFNDEAVIVARVRTEGMRMDREKEIREAEQSGNQDPQAR